MKRLIVAGLCACLGLAVLAAETNRTGKASRPKLSKEERRQRFLAYTGGYIVNPATGKGKVVLVDCASGCPAEDFVRVRAGLEELLQVHIEVVKREGLDLANADDVLRETGAGAAVIVARTDPKLPPILSAPDNRWAFVNVAALPEGNRELMRRETIRALAFCAGGALSQAPITLMGPFANLKQVESLPVDQMPYDVSRRVLVDLKFRGVEPYVRDFYSHACEQGWAPEPTNEVQKAVWERIAARKNAKPSNPIEIKPGQKPMAK